MEQAMRSRARVSVALRQYHDCSIFMSLPSVQFTLFGFVGLSTPADLTYTSQ